MQAGQALESYRGKYARILFVFLALHAIHLMRPSTSFAQGLRISTQIFDITHANDGDRPGSLLSSSLTLCHNGRVYDYVSGADELVVYDPVEKSFTIMTSGRNLVTTVSFDEIRHHLENRTARTEEYLSTIEATALAANQAESRSIRFQLNPRFTESFDPMRGTLVLAAPSFTYRVETRKWEDVEQVERYLTYRDWTARLNSMLHPDSLFPEPRLALHDALRRQKDRIPVSVELDRRPEVSSRLRAEHQLTVGLTKDDNNRIAMWDETLRSQKIQRVSLRKYQQTTLMSQTK